MYALNLGIDGRVLSATSEEFAPAGSVLVNNLPEGDIYDYLYKNDEYVYDPLPKPTPEPSPEERIAELEAALAALLGGLTE